MNYLAVTERSIELVLESEYLEVCKILSSDDMEKKKTLRRYRFIEDTEENFEKENLKMTNRINKFNATQDPNNKYYKSLVLNLPTVETGTEVYCVIISICCQN